MKRRVSGAKPVGILAGNGTYPNLLAGCLLERGLEVAVAGIAGQFNGVVPEGCAPVSTFPLGALESTAGFFLSSGARLIFMAGGVTRKGAWKKARPDFTALKLIPKALLAGDDRLLTSVARALEVLGVEVGDPRPYIEDHISRKGVMAGPGPDADSVANIGIAARAARELGARDVGQSALALGGAVVGLEDRRGTDALIAMAPGPGAVLAKVSKPGQDPRFDLPAVGPSTALAACDAGLSAIAVEAGGVLMLERDRLFDICGDKGISLIGI